MTIHLQDDQLIEATDSRASKDIFFSTLRRVFYRLNCGAVVTELDFISTCAQVATLIENAQFQSLLESEQNLLIDVVELATFVFANRFNSPIAKGSVTTGTVSECCNAIVSLFDVLDMQVTQHCNYGPMLRMAAVSQCLHVNEEVAAVYSNDSPTIFAMAPSAIPHSPGHSPKQIPRTISPELELQHPSPLLPTTSTVSSPSPSIEAVSISHSSSIPSLSSLLDYNSSPEGSPPAEPVSSSTPECLPSDDSHDGFFTLFAKLAEKNQWPTGPFSDNIDTLPLPVAQLVLFNRHDSPFSPSSFAHAVPQTPVIDNVKILKLDQPLGSLTLQASAHNSHSLSQFPGLGSSNDSLDLTTFDRNVTSTLPTTVSVNIGTAAPAHGGSASPLMPIIASPAQLKPDVDLQLPRSRSRSLSCMNPTSNSNLPDSTDGRRRASFITLNAMAPNNTEHNATLMPATVISEVDPETLKVYTKNPMKNKERGRSMSVAIHRGLADIDEKSCYGRENPRRSKRQRAASTQAPMGRLHGLGLGVSGNEGPATGRRAMSSSMDKENQHQIT